MTHFPQQHLNEHQVQMEIENGATFHYWVGDTGTIPQLVDVVQENILCWKATGEFPKLSDDNQMSFVAVKEYVTCQECREWIGA